MSFNYRFYSRYCTHGQYLPVQQEKLFNCGNVGPEARPPHKSRTKNHPKYISINKLHFLYKKTCIFRELSGHLLITNGAFSDTKRHQNRAVSQIRLSYFSPELPISQATVGLLMLMPDASLPAAAAKRHRVSSDRYLRPPRREDQTVRFGSGSVRTRAKPKVHMNSHRSPCTFTQPVVLQTSTIRLLDGIMTYIQVRE